MKEDFLHYIWKFQQWTSLNLITKSGQTIEVVDVGVHNQNAGPDFLDAKIRIDHTLWAGNVEIHISASDWYAHKHQLDKAYDNVILHVVFNADRDVMNSHGEPIPCLEIADYFDYQSYRYYKSWVATPKYIPCAGQIEEVPSHVKLNAILESAVLRMESKAQTFLDRLVQTKGDIEASFHQALFTSVGMKVNAIPFEQLSRSMDFAVVRKVSQDAFQLEALFLGQAGFLEVESTDTYVQNLKKEYAFSKQKHQLVPMPAEAWKFFRLRPQNFPTIRLVQLSRIYAEHVPIAQKVIEYESLSSLKALFEAKIVDGFWKNHYTLKNSSAPKSKSLGATMIDTILINAVAPFLTALSQYNKDVRFKEKAISLLEQLPFEKNQRIRKFVEMGFSVGNAFESQGVLHLYDKYCNNVKCLNCKIGIHLLRKNGKNH